MLFAQQKQITKNGLIKALKVGGLSPVELTQQVSSRGVDFLLTPDVEMELRQAGASGEVIEGVRLGQTVGDVNVCKAPTALRTDHVVGLIGYKLPDAFIAAQITSCHVSFALDSTALDRITAAGASDTVMTALNRDTFSRLSLAQARSEVDQLEVRKHANQASMEAARDEALRKLDADFEVERAKAGHIEPKGQFESTPEYNARVGQQSARLAAIEQSHEQVRANTVRQFSSDLARKNDAFDNRISFLKLNLYPLTGAQAKFLSYDADNARLATTIDGVEYWFSVEPHRAKFLYEHWNTVKVLQHFESGEISARFLSDGTDQNPVSGVSRADFEKQEEAKRVAQQKQEEAKRVAQQKEAAAREVSVELTVAQRMLASRDCAGAVAKFEQILSLDPANQIATAGMERCQTQLKAIEQREQQVKQQLSQLTQNPTLISGAWFDASTGLLWADRDNGKDVTWREAVGFCRSLTIGGYSDWQLGTVDNLKTLYDSAQKHAVAPPADAKGSYHLQDLFKANHIKKEVHLGGLTAWSRDLPVTRKPVMVSFEVGGQTAAEPTMKSRALCVRPLANTLTAAGANGSTARLSESSVSDDEAEHTIKLTPSAPLRVKTATIVAPGNKQQNRNFYYIDTSDFPQGGVLTIVIQIATNSETDGSFDLFPANARMPSRGTPTNLLVGRYDVPKGTTTRLEYKFSRGQVFALGLEGKWFSPKGATGKVRFRASVHQ